jgi:hypothetical protein
MRQQVELHRKNAACASCHARMDPLGFALENFDATGMWRDKDRYANTVIDSAGELPDGTAMKAAKSMHPPNSQMVRVSRVRQGSSSFCSAAASGLSRLRFRGC